MSSNWDLRKIGSLSYREQGVLPAHTGVIAQTLVKEIPFTRDLIGPNGSLVVTMLRSFTNSANAKTMRLRMNGVSGVLGSTMWRYIATSGAALRGQAEIHNVNDAAVQVSGPQDVDAFGLGTAVFPAAINTGATWYLQFTAELASAAESITLRAYRVDINYGA